MTNPFEVNLDWLPKETDQEWHNPLVLLLEVFGLPGERYLCRPTGDSMVVVFNSEKDAVLCKLMLSERLA